MAVVLNIERLGLLEVGLMLLIEMPKVHFVFC
jgi:hypothetical protein